MFKITEEQRKKLSESMKKAHKRKACGMYGKKQSKKWRVAILKSISKPCPEEKKNKISLTLKGRHCSPDSEFKKGQTSGKNNSNWKGGITPKNRLVRGSPELKEWREKVFKRDDYTCQGCNKRGSYLHAHHLISFANHPKYRFEVWNGQTACKPCHINLHSELGW